MSRPTPSRVTSEQVSDELGRLLKERTDIGLCNWLGDLLFELRNPFQPSRRQPKRWVSIVGALTGLALLIVCYFHIL